MMKLLVMHVLLLLFLPLIWHMLKKEAETKPAGTQAQQVTMTDSERDYYETIFSYAMQNLASGKSYSWQAGTASGSITVGDTFVSQMHSFCRSYAETYIVGGARGSAEGIACRRQDDDDPPTWCKLHKGEALTCALEHSRGSMGAVGDSIEDLFHTIVPNPQRLHF